MQRYRREQDSLGVRRVPATAYYGIHTVRATENFPITGIPIAHYPSLLVALAHLKSAAAAANADLDLLDSRRRTAVQRACREIIAGHLHDQFVVDVIQGGAGTSTNMNANEVVANRGLELMGRKKGEYRHLHPLDHVNLSQSTNDVYPTALKLTAYLMLRDLIDSLRYGITAFERKGREFRDVLTMGRTQLQDAVPMTLGQTFSAYAVTLGEEPRIQTPGEGRALGADRHPVHHGAGPCGGDAGHGRVCAAVGSPQASGGQTVQDRR